MEKISLEKILSRRFLSRRFLSKSLENSKSALVCCSDELRGWVSNNSPNSESCTSTYPCHPLELTGNFLVPVQKTLAQLKSDIGNFISGKETLEYTAIGRINVNLY